MYEYRNLGIWRSVTHNKKGKYLVMEICRALKGLQGPDCYKKQLLVLAGFIVETKIHG